MSQPGGQNVLSQDCVTSRNLHRGGKANIPEPGRQVGSVPGWEVSTAEDKVQRLPLGRSDFLQAGASGWVLDSQWL